MYTISEDMAAKDKPYAMANVVLLKLDDGFQVAAPQSKHTLGTEASKCYMPSRRV